MSHFVVVKKERYLDCLKNHAAALGRHSQDGCPQFVRPVGNSLYCVACRCHRGFHRRGEIEVQVPPPPQLQPMPAAVIPGVDSDDEESSASASAVTTNAPSASIASQQGFWRPERRIQHSPTSRSSARRVGRGCTPDGSMAEPEVEEEMVPRP
ncbi:hypothetical protein BRADI_1g73023v3 [Brachypodium distachyon]|uniref:ZF-HD dimerization-type domain-containing protein n=1 Tax=Brachypodium distachyon TaxID=15368 RepID=A0A0Q3P038_BRADI|nr:hypothetical protein BRADI_1g73023v3 [Brachypodium distachyon]